MPVKNPQINPLAMFIVLAVVAVIGFLLFSSGTPLKDCRFNESTGAKDVCYWIWDPARNEPSIYF